jgi:GAF domain-containing protein
VRITIRRHGQPLTVASSDHRAEQVDEAQYGAGTGPCLDSLETGAIIDVPGLTADTRWADFRHQVLAHGAHSSVSIAPSIDGFTVGALNLYGSEPHTFDQPARQHAETLATEAATALSLALRTAAQAEDTRPPRTGAHLPNRHRSSPRHPHGPVACLADSGQRTL